MSVPPPPPPILKRDGPLDAPCGKHISSMAHIPFACVTRGPALYSGSPMVS